MTTLNNQEQDSKQNTDLDSNHSTLIHLETERPEEATQAKDINRKIDFLDGSLGELNSELESIRSSVEEGLDRLSDTDMDLTSKVSDTYKRLGELDNTYKSLIEISSNIDNEIQKLTGNITEVASHSNAELEKLEATTEVHNSLLSQQNQTLVKRVNHLVTDSNQTTSKIESSINGVRETLLVAERKLLAEIELLAGSTQEKDENLSNRINTNNIEIESSKARILKCEKVDEAIIRRAGQLEISSNELTAKSKQMEESVISLDERTANLSSSILALVEHTDALRLESEKHSAQISDIQEGIADQDQTIFNFGNVEKNHFRLSLVVMLFMAVAAYLFYDYQTSANDFYAWKSVKQTQITDNKMSALNNQLQQEQSANKELNTQVAVLNEKLNEQVVVLNEKLNNRVSVLNEKLSAVDESVKNLDDQAQSLDGRLTESSPFDNFGGDNIVHGSQWLTRLPANTFVIQLTTAADKQKMYEIAQSYNRYLTQPLSYYADDKGQYVMFYGNFDSTASANMILRKMPYRINWQRPSIKSVSSVQKLIAL